MATITHKRGDTFDVYGTVELDGVVGSLDTSVTYVAPNVLRLAQQASGAKPARLSLSRIAIYPGQLTGAELEGITA